MISIKVQLNEYRSNQEGLCPLIFQVIYRRKKKIFFTPYRLPPDNFNEDKERVIDRPSHKIPRREEINDYISRTRSELLQSIDILQKSRADFSVEDIMALYAKNRNNCFFMWYMEKLIQEQKAEGRMGTVNTYRSTLNRLIAFIGDNKDFTFEDISGRWVNLFYDFLQRSGLANNSIRLYIRILRTVYNRAVKEEIPGTRLNSPFGCISISETETIKRAISLDFINAISSADLKSDSKLDIARDFFLFSFYCRGMSFVDMVYLRKNNIMGEALYYKRSKTGKPLTIKIVGPLRELIEKYHNEGEYVLPILDPAKGVLYPQYRTALKRQNVRLKRLSDFLNLPVLLTSYVARHSWATLAKRNGTPVSVISEALGHRSEKVTYIYLAALDQEVIDKVNEQIVYSLKQKVKKSYNIPFI